MSTTTLPTAFLAIYPTAADLKSGDAYVLPLESGVPRVINLDGEIRNRYDRDGLPVYSPRFAKGDGAPVPAKVPGAVDVNHGTLSAVHLHANGEVYHGTTDRAGRWTFLALAQGFTFTTDGPDTKSPGSLRVRPVVSEYRKGTGADTLSPVGMVNLADLLKVPEAPAPAAATGKVRVRAV